MTPSVSVVICAYTMRRWQELGAAIRSALEQEETSEVVVVIDYEEILLKRVQHEWPSLTVVPNTFRQGLSGARNTGISRATGEIVAFLDDDAVAQEGWLHEMLSAFAEPDVVAVGGNAQPVWPDGRAVRSLPAELLWVVGCSYAGQPTERAEVRNVIGCSMAFRADVLRAIGGFNLDVGRVGTIPLGAEETEACIRIRQVDAARRILLEPRSRVLHNVSADRTTWRYLFRRSYFEGVSKAALAHSLGTQHALSAERAYVRHVLPRAAVRLLLHGRPLGALAIVVSLASAGAGYLRHTARRRAPKPRSGVAPAAAGG